jgi:hypothetical protein
MPLYLLLLASVLHRMSQGSPGVKVVITILTAINCLLALEVRGQPFFLLALHDVLVSDAI